jgi:hypothetical protein
MQAQELANITPILAKSYTIAIPAHYADMAFALDMFFDGSDPVSLLAELQHIIKQVGVLKLDDRELFSGKIAGKLNRTRLWEVQAANYDFLRCIQRRDIFPT